MSIFATFHDIKFKKKKLFKMLRHLGNTFPNQKVRENLSVVERVQVGKKFSQKTFLEIKDDIDLRFPSFRL